MRKISILIPTLDRNAFLEVALQSLIEQTYEDWEAIIVDNGAGAPTASLVAQFNDKRLKYVSPSENIGECGGRNLALKMSQGQHVCYLDDDDFLPPDSLQRRLDFLNQFPDCGMIYGNYELLYETDSVRTLKQHKNGPPYRHKNYYDRLLSKLDFNRADTLALLKKFNFVRGGTPLIRRQVLEMVGYFDEDLLLYGDYDMWLRIVRNYSIRYLNETVYTYRIHAGSISRCIKDRTIIWQNVWRLCQKHGIRQSVQFSNFQEELDRWWNEKNFNKNL